jgi:hypothetical protein
METYSSFFPTPAPNMFTMLQPPHGVLQFCRVMVVVITLFSSATLVVSYQLHPDEGKRVSFVFIAIIYGVL